MQRFNRRGLGRYPVRAAAICCVTLFAFQPVLHAQGAARPETARKILDGLRGKEFNPDGEYSDWRPLPQATIGGSIRTADGAPLPPGTRVSGMTARNNHGASFGLSVDEQGRFSKRLEAGTVTLYAEAPGYAPTFLGPRVIAPNERAEALELVLDRGFTGRIQLLNQNGQAVVEASATTAYWPGGRRVGKRELHSDEQGVVSIEHCVSFPLEMEVRAVGYQFDRRELTLKPNEPASWKLVPARPTTGIVQSKSGEPIAGAVIYLASRRGYADSSADPRQDSAPVLATTDVDGHFRIDTLRDDCEYILYVNASDYGSELVGKVRAGQEGRVVNLGPSRHIRGRLLGDVDSLKTRVRNGQQERFFYYTNAIRTGHASHGSALATPVEIRDGVGYFRIADLFPGRVRLEFPGQSESVDFQESIGDLQIRLDSPKAADPKEPVPAEQGKSNIESVPPQRAVVLRFQSPEGAPAPEGKIRLLVAGPERRKVRQLSVEQGEAKIDVPIGAIVSLRESALFGFAVQDFPETEIPAGEEPFDLEVATKLSGAIYGQVRYADGSPSEKCSLVLSMLERPHDLGPPYGSFHPQVIQGPEGRFAFPSLPLGGVYRLLVVDRRQGSEGRVISSAVVVDEQSPHRELNLVLPDGITLRGRVLDSEEKPIAQVPVDLRHRLPSSTGFGTLGTRTDDAGWFEFQHVNPDIPGVYTLTVRSTRTLQGQQVKWEPSVEQVIVRLEQGESLRGVVLDDATGNPIPYATVKAQPTDYRLARSASAETSTDAQGKFLFENLQKRKYSLEVEEAVHPSTVIRKNAGGGYSYRYPEGQQRWQASGGQDVPVSLRVQLKPDSQLDPRALD